MYVVIRLMLNTQNRQPTITDHMQRGTDSQVHCATRGGFLYYGRDPVPTRNRLGREIHEVSPSVSGMRWERKNRQLRLLLDSVRPVLPCLTNRGILHLVTHT